MTAAFRVRESGRADLAVVERLLGDFNEDSGWPRRPVHPGTRRAIDEGRADGAVVFVAETPDGEAFGLASAYFALDLGDGPGVWLSDLYVAPARRRLGAGRALVGAVGDWGRARGGGWMGWHTGRDNERAKAFYAALGAREMPEHLAMSLRL